MGRNVGGTWIQRDPQTNEAAHKFGNAVRRARKQLGLTQTELARIVHATQPSIRQIEIDGMTPASSFFFPLCEELGLDPESFGFLGRGREIIQEWIEDHEN